LSPPFARSEVRRMISFLPGTQAGPCIDFLVRQYQLVTTFRERHTESERIICKVLVLKRATVEVDGK
jgi:hypothetical protein